MNDKPIGCVQHDCAKCKAQDDKVVALEVQVETAYLQSETHKSALYKAIAERDALQGEVARLKRVLGNVHNNGANWLGQSLIRDALAASPKTGD